MDPQTLCQGRKGIPEGIGAQLRKQVGFGFYVAMELWSVVDVVASPCILGFFFSF